MASTSASASVIHKPLAHTNYFCILFILKIGRNLFISPRQHVNVYIYALCHFVFSFSFGLFPQKNRQRTAKKMRRPFVRIKLNTSCNFIYSNLNDGKLVEKKTHTKHHPHTHTHTKQRANRTPENGKKIEIKTNKMLKCIFIFI